MGKAALPTPRRNGMRIPVSGAVTRLDCGVVLMLDPAKDSEAAK
jgi:hypothetical protein